MAQYSINVGVNSAQAARGIQQIRSSLRNLNTTADRSRNILSTLFIIPLFGIYTLQSALINVVSVMAEYSEAMAQIRAVSGATVDQTRALNREFQRLGITTRFTATEAAGAGIFLSRAGFNPEQILGITGESLELALATSISPDLAADLATNVLTAFALPISELGTVFDQLAYVANRTNTDITALGEALKFIGPSAKSANIPLNEIIAGLGILAQAGLRGSIAGTSLRRVLSGLASESPIVAKRLAELGLNFDDVNLTGGNLLEVFRLLIENGVELGEAFALFGVRGGPGFEALGARFPEFERLANEIKNVTGFVDNLVRIMETSLSFALDQIKSAIEGVVLAVGEILETDIQEFLSGVTTSIRNMAREADLIVNVLQTLALAIAIPFVSFLIRIAPAVLGFFTGLSAVVRNASAFIAAFFSSNGSGGLLSNFATRLSGVFAAFIPLLFSVLNTFKLVFGGATIILVAFSDKIRIAGSEIATLQDFFVALGSEIVEQFGFLNPLVDAFSGGISGIVDTLKEFITGETFLQSIVDIFNILLKTIRIVHRSVIFILDTDTYRQFYQDFATYIRIENVKLSREIASIVTRALDFISLPTSTGEQSTIGRLLFGERNELFTEELNRRAQEEIERLRGTLNNPAQKFFANVEDLLATDVLNLAELLTSATNIAVTRSLEGYRDQIQRIADQPIVRAELNPPPQRLTADEKRNRLFNIYLQSLAQERSYLGQNAREREYITELLEAQKELGFDLNAIEKERLRTLLDQGREAVNQATFADAAIALIRENEFLKLNSTERERAIAIRELEIELGRSLFDTERTLFDSLLRRNQVLRVYSSLVDDIISKEENRVLLIAALNEAFRNGVITLERLNFELRNIEIDRLKELLETGEGTIFDGVRLGILELQNDITSFSDIVSRSVQEAFKNMEDALVEFATTGKITFSDLVNSIVADLVRLSVRAHITAPLLNFFSGLFTPIPGSFGGTVPFGSPIPLNRGGEVYGRGTSTSDSIRALLSNGEFVVNAAATSRHRALLHAINSGATVTGSTPRRGLTVQYIDQRGAEEPDIETEFQEGAGPNGDDLLKVVVGRAVRNSIDSGEQDGAMNRRFGLRPQVI